MCGWSLVRRRLPKLVWTSNLPALPYLNRYLENADELVIVGLMSASGGEQIVRDEFGDAPLFAESVSESIYEMHDCDIGGFAQGEVQGEIEHYVVVVNVALGCEGNSGDFSLASESSTLGHEVMHIAQFELTGMCAFAPAWFDEGQAEFVAGILRSVTADSCMPAARGQNSS